MIAVVAVDAPNADVPRRARLTHTTLSPKKKAEPSEISAAKGEAT